MTKTARPKITAVDVRSAIYRDYGSGYRSAVAFEVGDDTGSKGSRRCDAMVVALWPSDGYIITGVEIKVSRADWLAELADAGKAESFARHCDRWVVAAPAGVVMAGELPVGWGLWLVGDDGRIKVSLKPLPRPNKIPMSDGMLASLVRRAAVAARDHTLGTLNDARERAKSEARAELDRLRTQLRSAEARAGNAEEALRAMRLRVCGKGHAPWLHDVPDDEVERALTVASAVNGPMIHETRNTLEQSASRLASIVSTMEAAATILRIQSEVAA